jgi:hypothetical protein
MKKVVVFLLKLIGAFVLIIAILFAFLWVLGKAAEDSGVHDTPYQ